MSRSWMKAAIVAGWLGVSGASVAQDPMAHGAPIPGMAAPGALPPGASVPMGLPPIGPPPPMPSYGPGGAPLPPSAYGPGGVLDYLPANGFSAPPEAGEQPHHLYVSTEYIYWWVRKRQIPALVTRGVLTDPVPGAAGQPGTTTVIGPGGADNSHHSGGRVAGWYWFDDAQTIGIDASAFILEDRSLWLEARGTGADGERVLARPFLNPNSGSQDADPISVPNAQAGQLLIRLPRRMYGGDLNIRWFEPVSVLSNLRLGAIAGVKFVSMDEKIQFMEKLDDLPAPGSPANSYLIHDNFTTYNRFYGGQLGLQSEVSVGPLNLTMGVKVAAGQNVGTLNISGNTVVVENTVLGQNVIVDNTRGFLAHPTNIGRYRRHTFAWAPEANMKLGVDFNSYVRAWVGYDVLWWTDVLRPTDHIDTTINLQPIGTDRQLGVPRRPTVILKSTDIWAQGLSLGVLLSF